MFYNHLASTLASCRSRYPQFAFHAFGSLHDLDRERERRRGKRKKEDQEREREKGPTPFNFEVFCAHLLAPPKGNYNPRSTATRSLFTRSTARSPWPLPPVKRKRETHLTHQVPVSVRLPRKTNSERTRVHEVH